LVIGIIILLFSIANLPILQAGASEDISKPLSKGNNLYVGGSGEGNYSTIQSAIEDAVDGDTVFVFDDSSPYNENLYINNSINLIGENRDSTVIFGVENWSVILISADYVEISGFSVLNSGDMSLTAGIDIRSNYTLIEDNLISTGRWSGINIWGSSNTINNNIIDSNFISGIFILYGNSNTIEGNVLSNNSCGIGLFDSHDNTINDNEILGTLYGLLVNGSCNNLITSNIIIGDLRIGILFYYSKSNNIIGNEIKSSMCGIDLRSSKRNTIQQNNFLRNNRNAYFENCRNEWKNNYWNRPRLLPKIIRGAFSVPMPFPFQDIVFRLVNFDLRPALKPYDIKEPGYHDSI
jgi:parallel beta-helix repeat protein